MFAYSFLKDDDQGIGQRLTKIAPYFDVIAPMAYPSHYSPGNFGFKNPALEPYQVVLQTILRGGEALGRLVPLPTSTTSTAAASSMRKTLGLKTFAIRPWIQAFSLGAVYDPAMIREEVRAVYDAGLTHGWMAWNARNVYDESAFDGTATSSAAIQ